MAQRREHRSWSIRWLMRWRRARWAISHFPQSLSTEWADTQQPAQAACAPAAPAKVISPGGSLTRLFNRNGRMHTSDGTAVDSRSALRQLHIVEQTLQMGQTLELVPPTTLSSALLQLRMLRAVDCRRSVGLELLQRVMERQIAYADIHRFVTSTRAAANWRPGHSSDSEDEGEFFTGEFAETSRQPLLGMGPSPAR